MSKKYDISNAQTNLTASVHYYYKALFTDIAFIGHISWQQKQDIQPLFVKCAFLFFILIICGGQLSAHLPQPTHNPVSTLG